MPEISGNLSEYLHKNLRGYMGKLSVSIRVASFLTLGLVSIGLVRCGKGHHGPMEPEAVSRVVVRPDNVVILKSLTRRIDAIPMAADGDPLPDRPVEWESDDPSIASVSGSGVVTGVTEGTVLVHAQSEGAEAAATVQVTDLEDSVETMLFGEGPLAGGGTFCNLSEDLPPPRRWIGFPRGTMVTISASTSVPEEARQAIHAALDSVPTGTMGAIAVGFQVTEAPHPVPGENEVVVFATDHPTQFGCRGDYGCQQADFRAPGVLRSVRVVSPTSHPARVFVHDVVGHSLLGLCGIHKSGGGYPDYNSLMVDDEDELATTLTSFDMSILRTVYGSSLDPGATLDDFIAAGLVSPPQ